MTPALCQKAIPTSGADPGENLTHKDLAEDVHSSSVYRDEAMGMTYTSIPRRPRDGTDTQRMPPGGPLWVGTPSFQLYPGAWSTLIPQSQKFRGVNSPQPLRAEFNDWWTVVGNSLQLHDPSKTSPRGEKGRGGASSPRQSPRVGWKPLSP